ncbi:hypothetical protein [uncultured Roseobacter sp.]|uniref:hypothetical protein n=1 Tax=uncultured Roseobacter sp. TaxID=114847 RepID=UPI002606E93F|nr:hypothetical protein [uncultured Roseobacter sp.]
MRYHDIEHFLSAALPALQTGPVAVICVEDEIEVTSTLRHHLRLGFRCVIALMPKGFDLPEKDALQIHRIDHDTTADGSLQTGVNRLAAAAPGVWMFYCYNAEYLFFPFCETRSIGEMLDFHAGEQRQAMLTYVIDLYADDLEAAPHAVCRTRAHLDSVGYYALARTEQDARNHTPKDRQYDFYGGLNWRFEEHVPAWQRRIDRISLFRAQPGVILRWDHVFSEEEYNTYACPWHHNLTAAVCSFRTAKALRRNPQSAAAIPTFKWQNSVPFTWGARQLLDLGLIEPGQWF